MTWQPSEVTLHDGRVVLSDSEDWRHECEARAIMNMPGVHNRRRYLYGYMNHERKRWVKGIKDHRGEKELQRLESTIRALWSKRQPAQPEVA